MTRETTKALVVALFCILFTGTELSRAAAQTASGCTHVEAYHQLDFWLGHWSVVDAAGNRLGRNRIESVMNDCAIMEYWTAAGGGEGRSLFYYEPGAAVWKQVWITENAIVPGGTKEKRYAGRTADGGIRFQGMIQRPDGSTYLDRTTLTPASDGRVRQQIEISVDEGATWRMTFDAWYVREAWATPAGEGAPPVVVPANEVRWRESRPGMALATVDGDPSADGGTYGLLMRLADAEWIRPHWHPNDKQIIVLSGALRLGWGELMDKGSSRTLPAGSYARVPARARHYEGAVGETVVLFTGTGPLKTNWVGQASGEAR